MKKDKRDLASVVLEETVATALEKDLKFFVDSKEWCIFVNTSLFFIYFLIFFFFLVRRDVFDAKKDRARGVPYRRGYLLHGPPGTGKTSFILALAGKMGYDLCTLNINSMSLFIYIFISKYYIPPD